MRSTQNQQTQLDPKEREKQLQQEPSAVLKPTPTVDNIKVWMTPSTGFPLNEICLNWEYTGTPGKDDYVALYDADPQVVGALGYLWLQWQWVVNHTSPYQTSTDSGTGQAYWIAYCSWSSSADKYVVLSQSGPSTVPPSQ